MTLFLTMVMYFLVMQFSLDLLADELIKFKAEEEASAVDGAPRSSVAEKIDSIKQRLIACAIGDTNHDGTVTDAELTERLAALNEDQRALVLEILAAEPTSPGKRASWNGSLDEAGAPGASRPQTPVDENTALHFGMPSLFAQLMPEAKVSKASKRSAVNINVASLLTQLMNDDVMELIQVRISAHSPHISHTSPAYLPPSPAFSR